MAGIPLDSDLLVHATHCWLRTRGVLSHRTAASLQGLLDKQPIVDVSTTGYLRAPHPCIRVHRVPELEPKDLRFFDGLCITNPVRTVVDLAAALSPRSFDHVLDDGRRRMLIAERPLREVLDRLRGRGRHGTGRLTRLLDEGEFELPVPGSPFERRLLHFIEAHSLRRPERQFVITDERGASVARVDFAYPDLMVAIECDGKKHHSAPATGNATLSVEASWPLWDGG